MKLRSAIGAMAVAASLGGCGFDVMYADWKVNQMCKEDGGVTVLMRDTLPDHLKKANGEVDFRALEKTTERDPYYLLTINKLIEARDPVIRRLEYRIMRQRDGQLLGKSVIYMRPIQNVGDLLFHQDAHICPSANGASMLAAAVFSPSPR